MNQIGIQRLQMARYQIVFGCSELAKSTELAAAQAVIHFHDALETVLIVIADELGVPRRRIDFMDYVGQINSQNKGTLRHAKALDEVNDFRVAAKHRGVYPSPAAIKNLDDRVKLFVEENVRAFLGLDFNEVSLADLVRDSITRGEIKAAEESIARSAYSDALGQLAAAFQFALEAHRKTLPIRARHGEDGPRELFADFDISRLSRGEGNSELATALKAANRNWDAIRQRLDVVLLGIDPIAYLRFKISTPIVQLTSSGHRHVFWTQSSSLVATKGVCDFCLKFVLDTALRLESVLRIHDSWSSYQIRVIKATDYHSYIGKQWTKVGTMNAGEEIQDAKLTIVADIGDEFWSWKAANGEFFVPFDVCEILQEKTDR